MTKTKHPKNKAERRLIDHKKKKKGKAMRSIPLSIDNHNSAVESFLFSMRLIDLEEKVVGVMADKDGAYHVSLERVQEDNTNN